MNKDWHTVYEVHSVRHSELERASDSSIFRSRCPKCKDGVLLFQREQDTLRLAEYDCCISCGRVFRYEDIEDLRNLEL